MTKKKNNTDFQYDPSKQDIRSDIQAINNFPKMLSKVLKKMSVRDLHKSYRQEGWTALQVVHHLADSHMMAYSRMKKAVTEPNAPTIMGYDQDAFAECVDGALLPVKVSVNLLVALHQRWAFFLDSLGHEEFQKSYYHPELKRSVTLYEAINTYAWHGAHHLEQIKLIVKGQGVKVKKNKIKTERITQPDANSLDYPTIEEIHPFKVLRVSRVEKEAEDVGLPTNPTKSVQAEDAQILLQNVETLRLPIAPEPIKTKKTIVKKQSAAKPETANTTSRSEATVKTATSLAKPRSTRTAKTNPSAAPKLLGREKPARPRRRLSQNLTVLPKDLLPSDGSAVFE